MCGGVKKGGGLVLSDLVAGGTVSGLGDPLQVAVETGELAATERGHRVDGSLTRPPSMHTL